MTWDIKLSLYPVNGAPPPFFPPLAATKCPERDELGQDRKKRTLHAIWRVCSSKRDWQVAGSNASYPHAGRSVPSRGVFPHEEVDHSVARRSEEHTSELQSLMRISYAVFCLKKKKYTNTHHTKQSYLTTIQYIH